MKILFATATLFLIVYAGPVSEEKLVAMQDTCLDEGKVTQWDIDNNWEAGKSRVRDCFTACVNTKLGIMTGNGDWIKAKVIEMILYELTPAKADALADKCIKTKKKDSCDTVTAFENCLKAEGLEEA